MQKTGNNHLVVVTVILVLIALLMGAVPFAHRAEAAVCSGRDRAKENVWDPNYWVGWNPDKSIVCDTDGQYTVAIQRINWGMGYRRSGVDGSYGNSTHQDVISFQAYEGITQDGLVGWLTWTRYRSELIWRFTDGAMYKYGSPGYSTSYVHAARDSAANPDLWYNTNLSHTYFTAMDMYAVHP